MFSVYLGNQPEKFLKKSDVKLRQRIFDLIAVLTQTPVPAKDYDLRKIEGAEQTYRVRLSSFRVEYKVFWEQKEIWVTQISRRDENTYK